MRQSTVEALNTLDALWGQIDAARERVGKPNTIRPPDSFSVQEYADRYGLPYPTAAHQLRKMAKDGTFEQVRALAPAADGRVTTMKFYVLPKGKHASR